MSCHQVLQVRAKCLCDYKGFYFPFRANIMWNISWYTLHSLQIAKRKKKKKKKRYWIDYHHMKLRKIETILINKWTFFEARRCYKFYSPLCNKYKCEIYHGILFILCHIHMEKEEDGEKTVVIKLIGSLIWR